jgi:hypothetical protein
VVEAGDEDTEADFFLRVNRPIAAGLGYEGALDWLRDWSRSAWGEVVLKLIQRSSVVWTDVCWRKVVRC